MRIFLDTSYLYDLTAAPGKFSEAERKLFEEHDAQAWGRLAVRS